MTKKVTDSNIILHEQVIQTYNEKPITVEEMINKGNFVFTGKATCYIRQYHIQCFCSVDLLPEWVHTLFKNKNISNVGLLTE